MKYLVLLFSALSCYAEWTPEACYTRITNIVVKANPGVPFKNFRVVHSNGKLGPQLQDRNNVLPLLYPDDEIRVKSTLSSTGATGPRNPHSILAVPTGNQ